MSTQSASTLKPAALVPISVTHQGQRVDLAVPAAVPVAELLPGMINALGRLNANAATQGFRVILPSGQEVDQSRTLASQGVTAGSVLTVEAVGAGSADARYDDLVEAIGTSVNAERSAWKSTDSVQLSAYTATGLFVVAAGLLLLRDDQPILTAALAGVGAALVALAALVLNRIKVVGGAVALSMTVPVLSATFGFAILGQPGGQARLITAGAGALVGALICLLLPTRQRLVILGPLTIGGALILQGILTSSVGLPSQRAAALIVALATVAIFTAPWVGLAQMPARIEALRLQSQEPINPVEVTRQLGNADVAVLTLRITAGLLTVVLAPTVAVDIPGALLMVCVGVSAMLGTRSLYSQAEVLSSMIAGLLTVLAAGTVIAITQPVLLPWVAGVVITVGAFVLAWNVINAQWRPWLNRLADAVAVITLMAVLPLTLRVLGVA
jgi:type VII secretion integral membrane protein EccD